MDLISDLKAAKGGGKTDAELATAQNFQRKAQFYLDFVEAENSTGFHAPQEARAFSASPSIFPEGVRSRCATAN